MLLSELEGGKIFEPYTHVLVDETQYFAPAWIKLIQRVMTTECQLFMTADSAHNFSSRILNWHDTGIELRGNTTNLVNSYRCNTAISRVADGFRVNRNLQTLNNPLCTTNRHELLDSETQPKLLQFPSPREQKRRLFSEIHQLIHNGTPAKEILILCANKQASRLLAQDIKRETNTAATAITGSMTIDDNSIKLCDMESASGLQSQVVFVTGIEELITLENSPESNAHDRRSLKIEHTQLLHMAMTRASERLYLLITALKIPEEWQIDGLITPTLSINKRAPVTYLNTRASAQ
jgi:superfamily I DNA/RNA helicase